MRIAGKRITFGNRKLLPIFYVGFLAGFLILMIGKSILLEDTGLFDEDTLYRMKYISVDGGALFCYVFRKRMLTLLCVAILSTTYLGYVVCMGSAAWCGMSAGFFVSSLMARYGVKGVVLAVVSVFPQIFFYIPAVILMLGWSESLYRAIYSQGFKTEAKEKSFVIKKLGVLGVIAILVLLGCGMEGYVNPKLWLGYLKVF